MSHVEITESTLRSALEQLGATVSSLARDNALYSAIVQEQQSKIDSLEADLAEAKKNPTAVSGE